MEKMTELLAPVRNDRVSAGKTPAATAGFVVSAHERHTGRKEESG